MGTDMTSDPGITATAPIGEKDTTMADNVTALSNPHVATVAPR